MNSVRQIWLVATREMRERSRSRAFRASVVVMIVIVVGVILLPTLINTSGGTKNIGLTGSIPTELPNTLQAQSAAVGTKVKIHRYDTLAAGEAAVRKGDVDVLVVDARRLEWKRKADEKARAVVAAAIQLVAVRERAVAAGISPDDLLAIVAPVPITDTELGSVTGRSPDDETAAMIMNVLLFISISTYGNIVLAGVVEEKSSRVVEVLLARLPARNLLAGKVVGIGMLGLAQIGVTALAALAASTAVDSFDVPAARGAVLAWVVVWFVLGYALYAMVYGAFGSLASRAEDAQAAAGPVQVLLIAGYFVSFAAVGSPDTVWARVVSFFPPTAPLAMPTRIAMGTVEWWEPALAVFLTLSAIAGLVYVGGRVYVGAILRSGPALRVRDAWRGTTPEGTLSPAGTARRRAGLLRRSP
ncbi:MAG: ABC transporter permease [Ilumatobacteraceae bacterium]